MTGTRNIQGKYYAATRSKAHSASLSVSTSDSHYSLIIERADDHENTDKEFELTGEVTTLDIPSRLADTQRRIGFADGSAFITDDNDAVDSLLGPAEKRASSLIHWLENSLRAVAFGLIVIAAGIYGGVKFGIPLLAERIAYRIPIEVQNSLSRDALAFLDRLILEPSALPPSEKQRASRLAMNALSRAGFADTDLQFRSGIGPNALTLPDGTVVITDELVELATDDQLVAVVYHELGHLENRHLLRRTLQTSFLALGVLFITGDVNSAEILISVPTLYMNTAYSRDFEREADRYALQKLLDNDIPIDAFAEIMIALGEAGGLEETVERVEERSKERSEGEEESSFERKGLVLTGKLLEYFATHPLTSERVALVEEYRDRE